jgi:hypothetical protein
MADLVELSDRETGVFLASRREQRSSNDRAPTKETVSRAPLRLVFVSRAVMGPQEPAIDLENPSISGRRLADKSNNNLPTASCVAVLMPARSAIELKLNLTDQKETSVSRFPVWSP